MPDPNQGAPAPTAPANTPDGGGAPTTGTPNPTEGGGAPETPTATFTQADLDRAVQQAITTREANLRKEIEAERLRSEGKHEELLKQREAELQELRQAQQQEALKASTLGELTKAGLGELADAFMQDLSSAEGRKALITSVAGAVNKIAEARVLERLKGTPPPSGGGAPSTTDPSKMTPEQYAAYKKEKGLV